MKFVVQFVLYLTFSLLPIAAVGQQPLLRHFTVKDGLPSNVVYKIFEDSKGFLWFCTDQGLSRFDGNRFQNYSVNEGLPDNEVFNMWEDKYHRLWIVCYNFAPCYIKSDRIYTTSNDPLCRQIDREKIKYTSHFIAKDGLMYMEGQRICALYKDTILPAYTRVQGTDIATSYSTSAGFEYLVRGNILNIKHGDAVRTIPLKVQGSYYSASHGNKLCIVGSENSANTFSHLTLQGDSVLHTEVIPFPSFCYELKYLSDTQILCLTTKGIYYFNIIKKQLTKSAQFPGSIPFNRMLIDSEGNTWLSTLNEGVYMQRKEQTFIINTSNGLRDNNVLSLNFQPLTGGITANFSNGEFTYINANSFQNLQVPVSGSLNRVKFTYRLSATDYLAGSDRGLFRINSSTPSGKMLMPDAQKSSYQKDDLYFIAHSGGALFYNSKTGWLNSFWQARTTTIAANDTNKIWLGSLNGLYVYSNGATSKFNKDSTLSNSRITSLAFLDKDHLVIATHKSGLYIWDGKDLLHIDITKGISSNNCNRTTVDMHGTLWICTDRGLDRISFEPYPAFNIYHFTPSDGLPTDKINDAVVSGENIYVATSEGIVVLNKAQGKDKPAAPRIYILSVATHDSTITYPDQPLTLPYNRADMQITYTGISLLNGANVQYRYVLEGGSYDTVYTVQNALNLSAIKPGNYRLLVWAKSGGGDNWSSKPAVFTFTVQPPFWFTPWFLTLVACSITLLVYAVYHRKVRSIERAGRAKARQQQQMAELEMQALRAQINPHFMFNALNSIQHFYSQNNERQGNHYMGLFAQLIRKTLNHSKEHWLLLSEELSMLTTYIDLEQMRFKNAFDYEVIVGAGIDQNTTKVPAMLIQPYVENAINHGLRNLHGRKGHLLLKFEKQNNKLLCSVDDNGLGIAEALKKRNTGHKSMGMEINRQRIETMNQIYATSITTRIIDKKEAGFAEPGTIITIAIPDIEA